MKRFYKGFLTFFLACLFSSIAIAQTKTISGLVNDEKGVPIPGVTVVEKGTTNGSQTDANGKFRLNVTSAGQTLVLSSVGYLTKEYPIKNGPLKLVLSEESTKLDDIVVVGYGTQKITKVSGAISTIKSADIGKLNAVRTEEAIQGQASGVTVIQNGSPGTNPTVFIRGIPSFSGNDPLVVIDGSIQTLTDFNSINAADIQSINILKDAATAAIYGVKGGNGVIVVTTKAGRRNQKTEFSINSNYGEQEVINTIGVLNATEYGAIINEGSTTSGGPIIFPDLSKLGVGTNWQNEIFKRAPIQTYNLSASGGNDKTTYFFALGYQNQAGIVGGINKSDYSRGNFTANLNFTIAPKLKFLWNTTGVILDSKGVQENSFNSIIGSALNFDPTVSVFNTVPNTIGTFGFSNLLFSEVYNPLTKLDNTYNQEEGTKIYGKFELQYDILKQLKFTSRFGYTKFDDNAKSFNPLVFYGPLNVDNSLNADGSTVPGRHNSVTQTKSSNFNYTWESYFNYNFKIKKDHNFETVAGFSITKTSGNQASASRQDVPFNSYVFADNTAATGVNTPTNTIAQTGYYYQYFGKNASFFGRANYDYLDKYLASFTARGDGSFAFGTNKKFGGFYSGSLGWVISNEDFFKLNFINRLKLRGSYGTLGNDANTQPQYNSIVNNGPGGAYGPTGNSNGYTFGNIFTNGSTLGSTVNANLEWERHKQLDFGFDLNFLKNKLSLTFDYWNKVVKGLLFTPSASLYLGTTPLPLANIGSTKSIGFEGSLGYNDKIGRNLKINTSLNFSTFKSTVTATNTDGTAKIFGGYYFNGQSQSVTVFEKGQSPGYFYGYKTDGLFQTQEEINSAPTQNNAQPGDIRYVDINHDGVIDSKDQTKIGNPFPKFTLGWNLGIEYKGIDFSALIYSSVGNDVYRAYERNGNYTNKPRSVLARWTGPNTTNDARYPRYSFTDPNNNARVSDRYVEDGSFVKVKNLQLGYALPFSFAQKTFSRIRIYGQVKNAFKITKYSGYDPEIAGGVLSSGVDYGAYPQARTYSLGLDVKF